MKFTLCNHQLVRTEFVESSETIRDITQVQIIRGVHCSVISYNQVVQLDIFGLDYISGSDFWFSSIIVLNI